jgi:hypothetical protein
VAAWLREVFPVEVVVSDLDTDPWTVHAIRDDLEIRP